MMATTTILFRGPVAVCILLVLISVCDTYLKRRFSVQPKIIRLCVLSNEPTRLQSQCVYCNYQQFQQTTIACTNVSISLSSGLNIITPVVSLPENISIPQAFCLIVKCIEQVPNQNPLVIGRKRRSLDHDFKMSTVDNDTRTNDKFTEWWPFDQSDEYGSPIFVYANEINSSDVD